MDGKGFSLGDRRGRRGRGIGRAGRGIDIDHCLIGLTHLGELSAWLACVAYAGECVFSRIGEKIDAMDLPFLSVYRGSVEQRSLSSHR